MSEDELDGSQSYRYDGTSISKAGAKTYAEVYDRPSDNGGSINPALIDGRLTSAPSAPAAPQPPAGRARGSGRHGKNGRRSSQQVLELPSHPYESPSIPVPASPPPPELLDGDLDSFEAADYSHVNQLSDDNIRAVKAAIDEPINFARKESTSTLRSENGHHSRSGSPADVNDQGDFEEAGSHPIKSSPPPLTAKISDPKLQPPSEDEDEIENDTEPDEEKANQTDVKKGRRAAGTKVKSEPTQLKRPRNATQVPATAASTRSSRSSGPTLAVGTKFPTGAAFIKAAAAAVMIGGHCARVKVDVVEPSSTLRYRVICFNGEGYDLDDHYYRPGCSVEIAAELPKKGRNKNWTVVSVKLQHCGDCDDHDGSPKIKRPNYDKLWKSQLAAFNQKIGKDGYPVKNAQGVEDSGIGGEDSADELDGSGHSDSSIIVVRAPNASSSGSGRPSAGTAPKRNKKAPPPTTSRPTKRAKSASRGSSIAPTDTQLVNLGIDDSVLDLFEEMGYETLADLPFRVSTTKWIYELAYIRQMTSFSFAVPSSRRLSAEERELHKVLTSAAGLIDLALAGQV